MAAIRTLTLNPTLDIHMFLPAPRLGTLNRAERTALEPSGKGVNVSKALARQGVSSIAVAPLGGAFGEVIRNELQGIFELRHISVEGSTRSNTKVIDAETGELTEFNAAGAPLREAELGACKEALLHGLAPGDTVVLSGSLPPGVPTGVYAELVREAGARGGVATLDTSGEALQQGLAAEPFLVKPNRLEAEALLKTSFSRYGDALDAAEHLRESTPHVILSLGAAGAVFAFPAGGWLVVPPDIKPHSTTGCGDALLAGVLYSRLQGWDGERTARYATAVATARALLATPDFPDKTLIDAQLGRVRVVSRERVARNEPLAP